MRIFPGIFKNKAHKFLSINFNQIGLEIAYLESSPSGFRLLNYGIKRGASAAEKTEETASDYISSFIRDNSISAQEVILNISEPQGILIKYLDLPVLPEKEVLEAAKWQLKEEISFNLEEALIDWQVAREYTDKDGSKKNGIIFAIATKEAINKYLAVISQCNLTTIAVTLSPFSYIKSLPESAGALAVLEINYRDSTLNIYQDKRLNLTRRLPVSWDKFAQSLTGVLTSDRGKVELSLEEAGEIVNTIGIPLDEAQVVQGNIAAAQIISLMRPNLENLVRELRLSFDYFSSTFSASPPLALQITGPGAFIKNMDKYLSKGLGITVMPLDFPAGLDLEMLAQDKLAEDKSRIISAVSAGLRDAGDINLLPLEVKTQKSELIQKGTLRVAVIIAAAILLFLLSVARFQVRDYNKRLVNAQQHLETIEEFKVLKEKIDVREDILRRIRKGKVPVVGLLKLVSAVLPPEIILDELSLDQNAHRLTLRGRVSITASVAESIITNFMKRLEDTKPVGEASLVSSDDSSGEQRFEISCSLVQ